MEPMKPTDNNIGENQEPASKGEIVIYKAPDGHAELDVRLEEESVWLNQKQIADLFGIQRPAITKHFKNIFDSGELEENSVSSILEHTAPDGKTYKTKFYNLDAIISVGYRVNSRQATEFRIWATGILKNYLVQGYALNQKRLSEQQRKFEELQRTITFIQERAAHPELKNQTAELLSLINDYSQSLTILHQYDEGTLPLAKTAKPGFLLHYDECRQLIDRLREQLISKGEAAGLFGREIESKFKGIVAGIYQTFGGHELYSSIEEKAANLLYLVIKDHPFSDGNKRIGSMLFVYFLEQNKFLFKRSGERKITDNTLVALALLIATSDPKEKDVMIKIITNLLRG